MKKRSGLLALLVLAGVSAASVKAGAEENMAMVLLEFVKLDAGIFWMGSPASEVSRQKDEIRHQVWVDTFFIGKNEITQREYERVMKSNPSRFLGASLPVEQVSWFDAIDYCNTRSIQEGLTPAYTINESEIAWNHNANGYRLPTEAEWEYACRADTRTAFHTGSNFTTAQGNYDGNFPYNKKPKGTYRGKTVAARSFAPNEWGLYDMHGNVYEWCWDQYKPYADSGETLDGSLQAPAIVRGGSWFSEAQFLRAANRVSMAHTVKSSYVGFRVVRSGL